MILSNEEQIELCNAYSRVIETPNAAMHNESIELVLESTGRTITAMVANDNTLYVISANNLLLG
jgi:hypothetical protein